MNIPLVVAALAGHDLRRPELRVVVVLGVRGAVHLMHGDDAVNTVVFAEPFKMLLHLAAPLRPAGPTDRRDVADRLA